MFSNYSTEEFVSFQKLATINYSLVTTLGLAIFLNLLFLLQLLKTSYRFRILSKILTTERFNFLAFFIQLGILHMGFSSFFYAYQGSMRYEYSTFLETAGSLSALFLGGGANFKVGWAAGNDQLSRVMVIAFAIIMTIIMLNLFISMIVGMIATSGQQTQDLDKSQLDPLHHLKQKVSNFAKDVMLAAKEIKRLSQEMVAKMRFKQ